jgi:IPT/TIG domain/FG-GAP repeat
MPGPTGPLQAATDRSHAGLNGRTAAAAVSGRALVAAGLLSLLLGGVLSERLGHQRGSVFALHSGASSHAVSSHKGLVTLPLAAQGSISGALGADSPTYRVRASGTGFRATSPAQHLQARFDRSGVVLSSGAVKLSLSTRAIGYGTSLRAIEPVSPSAKANRVSYVRAGVSEWFVNGPVGLEQGFTLARAPSGRPAGPLTLSMALSGDTHASLAPGQHSIVFAVAGGPSLRYGGLVATDARGHTLHSWLELGGARVLLRVDTRGARYPLRIDPLIQQGSKLSAGSEGLFGTSVVLSADGNTALIGAPRANGFGGVAWVFTRSGSTWSEQGPPLTGSEQSGTEGGACGEESGEEEGECGFGSSVALSADGNTALIGGPRDNAYIGGAWVFTREGSTWSQQGAKLTAGGTKGHFGRSVALSGDGKTALIGAPTVIPHGAAWVFTREGSTWSQQGEELKGGEPEAVGNFGRSVALSSDGNSALIGSPGDNHYVGAAWTFTRSSSTWTQLGAKLTGGGEQDNGHFGFSVALSGDASTALIGGLDDNEGAGAAWAFTRSPSGFTEPGSKLTGGEESGDGKFGDSVALSSPGDTALIGGRGDSSHRGGAWLFTRSGTAWNQQDAKLTGGGEVGAANFGASAALSADGETALIGGPDDNGKIGAAWAFAQLPAPTVTGVSPHEGVAGTEVTISGTRFDKATAVEFGSENFTSFTVKSPTEITAIAPAGKGEVDVIVGNSAGASPTNASDKFTYMSPKGGHGLRPAVTRVIPAEGPTTGGTVVTISGTNLTGATAVKFGSTGAAGFTVKSSTEISAVSPPGRPETVPLQVTTPSGISVVTSAANFTFVEPHPATTGGGLTGVSGNVTPRGGVLGFGPIVLSNCTIALRGKTIAVQSYKRAWVKLSWAGIGTCSGRLKLTVKTKAAHKRFKTRTIATGTFSIAPGSVPTVRVNLNALGRALLKARHGRLNASITITKLSPGPAQARTASVRLALQKPHKATKRKK